MARTSRADLEFRKRRVLRYLADHMAQLDCEATISYAELANSLNMSRLQARYTVRELEQEGLVRRQMCFRDDGGQTACLYSVTRRGFTHLELVEARPTTLAEHAKLQRGR